MKREQSFEGGIDHPPNALILPNTFSVTLPRPVLSTPTPSTINTNFCHRQVSWEQRAELKTLIGETENTTHRS